MNYLLPFFYGVLISITYGFFKYLGLAGGLVYFFWNCGILFLLLTIIKPRELLIFEDRDDFIRAILFGFTQCFIFLGLKFGLVGEVTLISFSGALLCNMVYHLTKGQYLYLVAILIAFLLLGWSMKGNNLEVSIFSILAGLFSGFTMLFTRKSNKRNISALKALRGNFLVSFILAGVLIFTLDSNLFFQVKIDSLLITTCIVLGLQAYYYKMFRTVPAAFVSALLLVRIPTAYLFDIAVFGSSIEAKEWFISFSFILLALFLTFSRWFFAPIKKLRYRIKNLH